jgi:hypothetical protein
MVNNEVNNEVNNGYPQNLTFAHDDVMSHFSNGVNTCFIHGSNRLAGMGSTLGVAPRHGYMTQKFASWRVSQQFAATTLRRLRGGPWKRRAICCENTQALGKHPVLCEWLIMVNHG